MASKLWSIQRSYFDQEFLLKYNQYFYMGTKLDNFKSTDEIDYDTVFKNHAVLMEAYKDVLKNS